MHSEEAEKGWGVKENLWGASAKLSWTEKYGRGGGKRASNPLSLFLMKDPGPEIRAISLCVGGLRRA